MSAIGNFFKRIFGTSHERMLRKIQPTINTINGLEGEVSSLSDEDLARQTIKFKEMLANGASLDDILPEAFATVREASKRVLNMRHYDVQLIGGVALHRGMIAEMKTGEGKTLVATSPMYLNALSGKGAHLVTVNDYLAQRDADWMGQIYRFLGLSVGKILTDLDNNERREAYAADITYGTNNEFGFDYLRDNMKYRLSDYVQRGHNFAIVDEVDSILIDEARTPLIISGQIEQDLNLYYQINKIVPFLKRDEDYTVDEKAQSVALNESGIEKVEKFLGIENIYDPKYIEHLHHVNKALQAHTLYKLDQNYVVDNGKVVIVDDFTGRLMPGRRWSDGLHQAIEAKEGVEILPESRTLATITFQNYFRMYDKLSGMTGTADTEAEEFKKIYKLDVFSIPTSRPIVRKDYHDVVYIKEAAKISAVVKQIMACHEKGQPVLVGTVSVEKSEVYSKMLSRAGIEHNVLNAKNHRREAEIIAQAGREGAVTIATNMAGRGTDILLGGNAEALARADHSMPYEEALVKYKAQCAEEKKRVQEAGGLFILGTERHESRRIDNQLRGRAGRQGDPGASRFFLSFDDDLLRIFGGDRFRGMMESLAGGDGEDVAIESGLVTRSLETAQRRVEGRNFDIRKNLIEYDDVMNKQRNAVYGLRLKILKGESLKDELFNIFEDVTYDFADKFLPAHEMYEDWDFEGFVKAFVPIYGKRFKVDSLKLNREDRDAHIQAVFDELTKHFNNQVKEADNVVQFVNQIQGSKSQYANKTGEDMVLELAQNFYLKELDQAWQTHLTNMTSLRESISFRGYAQKDPKQEYKKEAFALFEKMMHDIKVNVMTQVGRTQFENDKQRLRKQAEAQLQAKEAMEARKMELKNEAASAKSEDQSRKALTMAELMQQLERKPEEKKESSNRPMSMAEMMAQQAAAKPKEDEPKRTQSMADLMPVSMMQAMLDVEEERKRARERALRENEEAEARARALEAQNKLEDTDDTQESSDVADAEVESPKRSQSMADLMPASMIMAMEAQRKAFEAAKAEAAKEAEEAAREVEEVAESAKEVEEAAESAKEVEEAKDQENVIDSSEASSLESLLASDPADSLLALKDKIADLTAKASSENEAASEVSATEMDAIEASKSSEAQPSSAWDAPKDAEPSAADSKKADALAQDLLSSLEGLDGFGSDDDFGLGDLSGSNSEDIFNDIFGKKD